ncbi:dTMP kinase [Candidatus Parcubacteria bacterium]|nr:MAG: dTMP kinase [Candidatus Parcubacteria bacterium]
MKYHISFDIEFLKNPYPGKLIVIEGNEGSGKSTQVERLAEALREKDHKVFQTKEPSENPIGSFIREKILSGEIKVPPISIQYMYCADRAIHLEEIKDYLKNGHIVVCDRYFWSSVAYGIADLNGDEDFYLLSLAILSPYHRFIKPDFTLYLEVSLEEAVRRINQSHKHKEIYDKKEKMEKIKKGYGSLIKRFPEEFVVIDGEKSMEEVSRAILKKLEKKLK